MNLAIVSFDVAKDLNELGFDLEVLNGYFPSGELFHGDENEDFCSYNHNLYGNFSAPTQAEVVKWLRDKYKINFVIWALYGYRIRVEKGLRQPKLLFQIDNKLTYEEAELEGIKTTIEYLKSKS